MLAPDSAALQLIDADPEVGDLIRYALSDRNLVFGDMAWTSYGPDYGYEYFYQVSELSCEDEG